MASGTLSRSLKCSMVRLHVKLILVYILDLYRSLRETETNTEIQDFSGNTYLQHIIKLI